MTTLLQDATALTERIQNMLHHAPAGSPELEVYALAISHLQHCCDALASLPEPKYRMLTGHDTLQYGDEWQNKVGDWQPTKYISLPALDGHYRRPIATAQDFRDIEGFLTRCNSVYAQGIKQGGKA